MEKFALLWQSLKAYAQAKIETAANIAAEGIESFINGESDNIEDEKSALPWRKEVEKKLNALVKAKEEEKPLLEALIARIEELEESGDIQAPQPEPEVQ